MTDDACVKFYNDDGIWGKKEENDISSKKLYLESLQRNKKNLALKSQIDQANKDIKLVSTEIADLEIQKREIFGTTCETYGIQKANDHFIASIFFKDEKFEDRIIDPKNVDDIDPDFYNLLIYTNNNFMDKFSEEAIQHLCLEDFYYIYYPYCEDAVNFFGQPIVRLTDNQLQLISYTRIFKNIFERYDKIPESIRKDPLAVLDYGSISEEAREKMQRNVDREGGTATTLMGATKEDFEYVGLTAGEDRVVHLHEEAAKKGGSLNMEDLMKLSGH
jgi:hypothetical protein